MVLVCWAEYWAEWALLDSRWPGGKQWGPITAAGLALSAVGLLTRSVAMATASSNFSHIIEGEKRQEHVLVTSGVYALLRHPAYFGFFWWSVGTQLLLANPVCVLAYAVASFEFFRDRIKYEEQLLVEFFGDEYRAYRRRTYIGIPLLSFCV